MTDLSRRAFLNRLKPVGQRSKSGDCDVPPPIRPPHRPDEGDFAVCEKCDHSCADACEARLIEIGTDGAPFLNFNNKGCTFCGHCVDACKPGILALEADPRLSADPSIDQMICIAWQKTICYTCKDQCPTNAIKSLTGCNPTIEADLCNGCGECVSACFVQAISMQAASMQATMVNDESETI